MTRRNRQRGGTLDRGPTIVYPVAHVNDNGYDAPLTPSGRLAFRVALLGASVLFVVILILSLR
jgi:hypothetical protein